MPLYIVLCVIVSFFFKGETATCTRIYPQQRPIIVLQSEPHITNLIGKAIDLSTQTQSWAPLLSGFNSHAKNHSLIEGPTIERISLPVVGSPKQAHITSRRVLRKEKIKKGELAAGPIRWKLWYQGHMYSGAWLWGPPWLMQKKSKPNSPPPNPKVSRSCHFGATWGCLSGSNCFLPKYFYF